MNTGPRSGVHNLRLLGLTRNHPGDQQFQLPAAVSLGQYRSTNRFQDETPVLTGGSCQPILQALVQDVHGLRVYEPGLQVGDSAAQQLLPLRDPPLSDLGQVQLLFQYFLTEVVARSEPQDVRLSLPFFPASAFQRLVWPRALSQLRHNKNRDLRP